MKIILLGAPGAGKGTISEKLQKDLNLTHISTGNLFRKAIAEKNELSLKIKNILNTGGLVSDDITNEIAKKEILEVNKQNKGFILDGYPRTIDQAEFLNNVIEIDKVFYLNVPISELLKRITGRRICLNCNAIYNVNLSPKPLVNNECDKCHSILSQRKDDNAETALKRIEKYEQETSPLIQYYKERGKLVEIDATSDIDTIYQTIINNVNN